MYSTFLKYVVFIILYAIIDFILFLCGQGVLALILLLLLFPIALIMKIKLNLEREKFERYKAENLEEIAYNTRKTAENTNKTDE